jgi:hypothetical protein
MSLSCQEPEPSGRHDLRAHIEAMPFANENGLQLIAKPFRMAGLLNAIDEACEARARTARRLARRLDLLPYLAGILREQIALQVLRLTRCGLL